MIALGFCDACVVAAVSARDTGGVVECVCGARHGVDADRTQRRAVAIESSSLALAWVATPHGRPERVWRGDTDHIPRAVSPLARAGAEATSIARPDDPELVRVRRLLADLRPDCADPWEPPVESLAPVPHVVIRDPSASWGGTPRGLEMGGFPCVEVESRTVAEVLAEIDALPAPAPAVLRWLRGHATLKDGARGLYCDVGLHFAGDSQRAAWVDFAVRREGAPAHGRYVLLGAAASWGR